MCSPGCSFTAELFFTVPPIIHEHSIKLIDPTDVRSFFTAKKPQTVFFIFISRDLPDLYVVVAHLSDTFFVYIFHEVQSLGRPLAKCIRSIDYVVCSCIVFDEIFLVISPIF